MTNEDKSISENNSKEQLYMGSTPISGFKYELMTNQSHEKNRERGFHINCSLGTVTRTRFESVTLEQESLGTL